MSLQTTDELTLADLTEVGGTGRSLTQSVVTKLGHYKKWSLAVVASSPRWKCVTVCAAWAATSQSGVPTCTSRSRGREFLAVAADRSYQPITPGHVAMWNASKGFRIGYEGNIQDSLDLARRLLMNRKADIDTGPFLLMDLLYSDSNLLQYLDLIATEKVNRSNTPRGLSRIADRLAGRSGNSARPSTPRSRAEGVAIRQDVENRPGAQRQYGSNCHRSRQWVQCCGCSR